MVLRNVHRQTLFSARRERVLYFHPFKVAYCTIGIQQFQRRRLAVPHLIRRDTVCLGRGRAHVRRVCRVVQSFRQVFLFTQIRRWLLYVAQQRDRYITQKPD